jgi:23S rRNA pseudouridine1911/1915/1917 synthase
MDRRDLAAPMTDWPKTRVIVVPERGAGLRLDRLLSVWFKDWSRTALAAGIKDGLVTDKNGRKLRPSTLVKRGQELHISIAGIAPSTPPPPLPPVVFEDEQIVVVNKPAGLMAHPSGSRFVWSLIAVAKLHFPQDNMDLCHRLDRDTSGLLVLTKDKAMNHTIKTALKKGHVQKVYVALCKGEIAWDQQRCLAKIGPKGEEIRVQQGVREDGQSADTTVTVDARQGGLSRVTCQILTGRTHQIRVHLDHLGHPILGDRLYGVPPDVFLHTLKHGLDHWTREQTGAPRHALHCSRLRIPYPKHPEGLSLTCPMPEDMQRWWANPACLPHDEMAG